MIGQLEYDKRGNIINAQPSLYNPPEDVRELTALITKDYSTAYHNLHKSYEEFSNRSVLQEMNASQRIWNSYVPPRSNDPDEAWRAQTVRPLSRNKMISIAAHVTANLIYPTIFAQNTKDEEDQLVAEVMSDIIEWVTDRADYDQVFLYAVIAMLSNPAVIADVKYVKAVVKARVMAEQGYETKEVLDELESGIKIGLVPVDEFLVANVREFHLQRQQFVIRKKHQTKDQLAAKYKDHPNWDYIQTGVKAFYDTDTGSFYEMVDDENPNVCEEVIYYNRHEDMEVPYVNGIYLGKENIQENTFTHRRTVLVEGSDVGTIPVYPFAKGGYEPIDEQRFFYYKSAASKLGPDQDLVDTLYNMVLDGTFLSIMPPVNVFGSEEQDASVVFPGATNYFSQEAKVETMNIGQNVAVGMNTLNMVERSMSQSSQDDTRMGLQSSGGRTAFEIARMEQNAKVQLGLFGKMIGHFVRDITHLIIDDIILHLSVGEMNELTTGEVRMKYNSFLIKGKTKDGKQISKKIEFSDKAMGNVDKKAMSKDLLAREGMDSDVRIMVVNPYEFARTRYQIMVDADAKIGRSEFTQKTLNLEGYDRMIQNPLVNQEEVTRDFLVKTFAEGETEKYMGGQQTVPVGAPQETPGVPQEQQIPV